MDQEQQIDHEEHRAVRAAVEQEQAQELAAVRRYQVITRDRHGYGHEPSRHDIARDGEAEAIAVAIEAYGKFTGLDSADIAAEVIGVLDGHGVSVGEQPAEPCGTLEGRLRTGGQGTGEHEWFSKWHKGKHVLECAACEGRRPYQDSRNLPADGCPGSEYAQEQGRLRGEPEAHR